MKASPSAPPFPFFLTIHYMQLTLRQHCADGVQSLCANIRSPSPCVNTILNPLWLAPQGNLCERSSAGASAWYKSRANRSLAILGHPAAAVGTPHLARRCVPNQIGGTAVGSSLFPFTIILISLGKIHMPFPTALNVRCFSFLDPRPPPFPSCPQLQELLQYGCSTKIE